MTYSSTDFSINFENIGKTGSKELVSVFEQIKNSDAEMIVLPEHPFGNSLGPFHIDYWSRLLS